MVSSTSTLTPTAPSPTGQVTTLVAAAKLYCRSVGNIIRPRPFQLQCRHLSSVQQESKEIRTLRWGIAPVNLMAEDFVTALSVLPSSLHCINACMSTNRSSALKFADEHRVPNVFTSFEDLAHSPDVDAVYISPLNPKHYELCHLMLKHDKHVLCEQPLCMAEDQVVQLMKKARARGCFLMEGFWPRCTPAYHFLRGEIMRQTLGSIYSVECTLGWQLLQTDVQASTYAGVVRDLAPYGIQLALWMYQEVPERVKVAGRQNGIGIDVVADIELIFKENRNARLLLSAEQELCNSAIIRGSRGSVKLDNPWCPTSLTSKNTSFEFVLPKTKRKTNYSHRIGLCYEAEEMRKCILQGCTESPLFNHNESRLMANLSSQIKDMLNESFEESQLVEELQALC